MSVNGENLRKKKLFYSFNIFSKIKIYQISDWLYDKLLLFFSTLNDFENFSEINFQKKEFWIDQFSILPIKKKLQF